MTKLLDLKTKNKIINYLNSRFGIDKYFLDNYIYIIKGNSISIITNDKFDLIKKTINSNFVKNIGIEIFSNYRDYTPASLGFGIFKESQITINYIKVNRNQANNYFKNIELDVNDCLDKKLMSSGYVVCICDGNIIGTGKYLKEKNTIIPNLSFVNEKIK